MRSLNQAEEASWDDLVSLLGSRQLSLGPDVFTCSLAASQKNPIKSLYNKLTEGNSFDIARGLWKMWTPLGKQRDDEHMLETTEKLRSTLTLAQQTASTIELLESLPICGSNGGVGKMDADPRRLAVDGCDNDVSFDKFHHLHYYFSKCPHPIKRSFVHLKRVDLSKHTGNLSPTSCAILLSGDTEPYLQSLPKAVFVSAFLYRIIYMCIKNTDVLGLKTTNQTRPKTNLLLVNITNISLQIQRKYRNFSKALQSAVVGS
ncbi:hypothetical protein D1007_23058 [Hordeum vulgare]|nr:hypothetical protein D1007_23058 [Hordeum vulgare]